MINENSFWVDDKSKEAFLKSPTKIGNAFWTNLIGFSALYNIDKSNILLQQYFNQSIKINTVNDDSSDLFYIIKVQTEKGNISDQLANEITKYITILKKGEIDKVDVPRFRKILKKIKVSKVKSSAKLKPYIVDFITGALSLEEMIDPLYAFALKQKSSNEFRNIVRKIKPNTSNNPDTLNPSSTASKPNTSSTKDSKPINDLKKIVDDTIANNQINETFPLYKGNKDLCKLFLLKFVNGEKMYKKMPNVKNYMAHLKKFKTTADDLKMLVTSDDLKNMYETEFPKNHPELKEFYNINPRLFRPISESLFSRMEKERFQEVFNYKFWWIKYIKKHNSSIDEINKIKDIFVKEDFEELKDELKNIFKITLERSPVRALEFFKLNPLWGDYWTSEFHFNTNSFIWSNDSKLLHDNSFENAIKDPWRLEWIKKWYENASEPNKLLFIDMVSKWKLIDEIPFVDKTDIDESAIQYNKFINCLLKTPSNSKFYSIDGYKWLDNIGKLSEFIQEFEEEKFDDFFSVFNKHEGYRITRTISWFILNRKRPFNLDVFKQKTINIINFIYNIPDEETKLFKIFDEIILPYHIKNKIKLNNINTIIKKRLNETNYLEYLENCIDFKLRVSSLNIGVQKENISSDYIIRNKERFLALLDHSQNQIIMFYQAMLLHYNTIIFNENDYDKLANTIDLIVPFNDMGFANLIKVLFSKPDAKPTDDYKRVIKHIKNKIINDYETYKTLIINSLDSNYDEFINFITKNLKDKIKSFDSTTQEHIFKKLLLRNDDKLFDIYNDDEFIEKSIEISNTSMDISRVLPKLSNIKDIKNIKKFFETANMATTSIYKTNELLSEFDFIDIVEKAMDELPSNEFDNLLSNMFRGVKETTYINAIRKKILMKAVVKEIYDDNKSLIKPLQKLNQKRLNEILKFNNISVKLPPSLRRKKLEPNNIYLKRINDNHDQLEAIQPLNAERIVESDEDLERKTADYLKYYNFKHGNTALEFIESFDVNMKSKELDEFIKEYPKPTIIPFFHGTGSIGASMILRYGFKVLKKGDSMVVGRMLGDGIYISNIIEKAGQYIGDNGFGRKVGTIGYILEGDAYIGQKDTHHKSAGEGNDRIISPEWVLFDARAQLHIKKAHKVMMTTKNHVKNLAKKYNIDHRENIKENSYYSGFNNLLKEEIESLNLITYIFFDGACIDHNKNILEFEDFMDMYKDNENIIVTYGQLGPEVNIKTSADVLGSVHIPFTRSFLEKNPDDMLDQYITILTNAVEGEYQE